MIKEIVNTYPHMTDIHMTEGEKVVIRVNGILQRIDQETSPDFLVNYWINIGKKENMK